MDAVTPATPCEMNGRVLMDQHDREPQSHAGHRVLVKVQDLDHMARHSLNWEEFFGSSLDLAPSLLNIYDDIASSGGREIDKTDSEEEDFVDESLIKTQSLPAKTNGLWPSSSRPGILSSLSEPGSERPVSCMESEWTPASDQVDSKKRPLSLSSMSSASSSSLPRLRKKRANDETVPRADQVPCQSQVDIRSSVDSGIMEGGDRKGNDVTSTLTDMTNWKDDLDSSNTSLQPTSPETPRMTRTLSGNATPTSTSKSDRSSANSANSRTWTPRGKKTEPSDRSQKSNKSPNEKNSQISRTSASPLSASVSAPTTSTPDSGHRHLRTSRHEARKRFFSNYEEHMKSALVSSPASGHDRSDQGSTETLDVNSAAPTLVNDRTSESLHASSGQRDDRQALSRAAARKADGDAGRESPSHAPRRTEGRGGSRKDRHGSPSIAKQKSSFTKSTKRKDAGTNRDSADVTATGYVSYVQRVVSEIIESERIYISSLKDIIQGYLEPFEKILCSGEEVKDVECLFGNIREIYKFGCLFLTDLEATGADPVKVAQCFVRHNKGFVIYADYCTNYPRAVDVLTKFMKHPEQSELCKERQLSLGHGLPLGAYLLRPVQRILKYHLLLQNIVKNYEKEGKEMEILQQAFHHMTEMAHHINEMKRRHEHAVRIQEIQSQLEDYRGEDLTRLGELVLESTFRVYGAKASRHVFLFERGLLISKKTDGGMLSCKTFILCSNLMLVEVIPNEPLSFHVIPFDNPRAQYTLQARNMEQKKRWCQEIKRLILESFKGKIPDSVKSLVMQLGSSHDDDYITKEALEAVRKTQHTAPEYLEKRRFRRKSGSRLPDFSLLKPQKAKKVANKKNDKTAERRAESKSPDAHRRLIPKNAIKRRSHSHSVLTITDSLNTSADNIASTPASPSTDLQLSAKSPPIFSHSESKEEKSKKSKTHNPSEAEKEAELVKRAQSFRNAMRSHPITSADLTELVTRCGGSVHITAPVDFEDKDSSGVSFIDSPETSHLGLRSIDSSSEEDTVDGEQHGAAKQDTDILSENDQSSDLVVDSSILSHASDEMNMNSSQTQSLVDLKNVTTDNKIDGVVMRNEKNNLNTSQSVDNIYVPKGKGRLSRRDQPMIKKRNKENDNGEDSGLSRKVTAFHDSYSKRVAEKAILRNKGLRLPNTSKHLSAPDSDAQSSAKLTDWNSVDKFTAGSMNDLSHMDEDPWVINTEMTSSESSMDMTDSSNTSLFLPKSTTAVTTRPRGHSDITEMMQLAFSRDNFDWLVYLNRNSMPAKSNTNTLWSPASILDKEIKIDALSQNNNTLNHPPYATPPRSFMTTENMKRHNYVNDNSRNSYQKKSSGVNAFGGSTQTVKLTKPALFQVPSLTRSNSTPLATTRPGKSLHERRPSSMDVDKLTDESNRMVAEMEEYISNSTEEIRSTNKFPTSLPTITVEEEDSNCNRLSVVSSLSASSYESQESSSSDGLVGTLKHKLHVWANHSSGRRDSEHSRSSTLTSDEDEEDNSDDTRPLKSGNTFDPPLNIRNSWRESRDLEIVLREHSLGSTSLGSRMAHALPENVSESATTETAIISPTFTDGTPTNSVQCLVNSGLNPSDTSSQNITSLDITPQSSESLSTSLDHNTALQSDSPSSQTNDLNMQVSTTTSPSEYIPEPVLELSEDSSKETTPKFRPKIEKNHFQSEQSNLKKESSLESLDSNDSFYERRFSVALDSEVFVDKPVIFKASEEPQAGLPRKSIREYVQQIEQKFKPQSPQIFEVKRKEPSAMIRQRLETLRENVMHSRHLSSSSRQASEERECSRAKSQPPSQNRKKLPTGFKTDNRWNDDLKIYDLKASSSRDSLTKSLEKLSKSRENLARELNLSKSKENLLFQCDSPKASEHEKDASRFIYITSEHSCNQFIHRAQSNSDEQEDPSMAQSMTRFDPLTSDVDNLVIMKGWVKALISKTLLKNTEHIYCNVTNTIAIRMKITFIWDQSKSFIAFVNKMEWCKPKSL
ncbi:hypothetical protein Btru_065610 [Bulinus truncatus]|nr:hypothetical protein Btru_065610 [Bulinus truncatus]